MATVVEKKQHAFDAAKAAGRVPYKVADLTQAEFGRKEMRLAEQEMPGLMSIRREYAASKPLAGTRDRKSTRLNSSHGYISYAVFCLKKKNKPPNPIPPPLHTDNRPDGS